MPTNLFTNAYLGNGIRLVCTITGVLYLQKEGHARKRVGELAMDMDGEVVEYIKEDKTKDIFRKGDAWGFPHFLISNLPRECQVIVHATGPKSDKRTGLYYTTAETIMDHGFILHFKEKGLEKRIYLKRSMFGKR